MHKNRLLVEHHFDDIRALIQGGRAHCFVHGGDCEVPEERADFFAGGFACQPTSTLRASSRGRVKPRGHPLFETARLVVEYHLVRKPRVSLLEQTMGALNEDVFDGVLQSECEWIRSQLTHLYHVHWTQLGFPEHRGNLKF